jgi:hypothetical protein
MAKITTARNTFVGKISVLPKKCCKSRLAALHNRGKIGESLPLSRDALSEKFTLAPEKILSFA